LPSGDEHAHDRIAVNVIPTNPNTPNAAPESAAFLFQHFIVHPFCGIVVRRATLNAVGMQFVEGYIECHGKAGEAS
jgi:hypothetical protein